MYKVDKAKKNCIVYTKDGKVILNEASQKDLKKLFEMGVKGIVKVDKPKKVETE